MKKLLALIVLAACGGGGGGNNIDAAPPDMPVNVPPMITISGTATERQVGSTNPVEGLTVAAFKSTDEATAVVMTTTDAQGNYTLTIPTGGAPVDGFIKATKTGLHDTYLYPPAPLVADFAGASLNMLNDFNYGTGLPALCQAGSLDPAKGIIAAILTDAAGMPVADAKAAADPAATKVCYTDGTNPSGAQQMTAADGTAIMFNVIDSETVSATKDGVTFKSHTVKAFVNAFTTTLITQ